MVDYIILTKGFYAIIDEEDFDRIEPYSWHARVSKTTDTVYASRSPKMPDGSYHGTLGMHRQILRVPKGIEVDHIDGNGLNNQKANLRRATHQQNMQNHKKAKNNTTGYVGVMWRPKENVWWAGIKVDGKRLHLGT